MSTANLSTDILKAVSRSFYLTLRLLPSEFRGPLSLGYLLARLSDTIADAGALDVAHREEYLRRFCSVMGGSVPGGQQMDFSSSLQKSMADAGISEGERELVRCSGHCFAWLDSMEKTRADAIRRVVGIITEGQAWDLRRFRGEGVVSLGEDKELETYAYQVAGSVGEFWTEIGLICDQRFSRYEEGELRVLGANYGKGLQLVNILRDIPEDLERGRCYLPGVDPGDPAGIMASLPRWHQRAREFLADGIKYAASLRGTRVRLSTGLPAVLGFRTLDRLEQASWEDLQKGVKITRGTVRQSLVSALARSAWWLPGSWKGFLHEVEPQPNPDTAA